ncbi:hypothetical protein BHF71_06045 [Vulcanibacillus modesticaldus]|uniref:UPF0291 protein BHF71_06045 n=1 Tax=Vulcanibacillus modesticaldus TaxID=337097 RepID=A0A1D2YWW2_9BACI|nr:DUF896 domain-containing protein [Vulcanibacillus modesticaldus]OEG00162.1 hypothetical protein BHF71_06045 [Vulcanibacillus modesticaldus]
MKKEKIDRINELARKAKTVGLSTAEKEEQNRLRQEYIQAYRESLRAQLHSIKVVDKFGNDLTPKKLKEAKSKNNFH